MIAMHPENLIENQKYRIELNNGDWIRGIFLAFENVNWMLHLKIRGKLDDYSIEWYRVVDFRKI